MNAEIITVGTELLLGQVLDTNSMYLSRKLAELGINVFYKTTVGDNKERMVSALNIASKRAELIIVTGGLGPTVDDITREAIAEFTGEKLVADESIILNIEKMFKKRGIKMPEGNKIQAYFPKGAVMLENNAGTAPGFVIKHKSITIAVMPGVPEEMHLMMQGSLMPLLIERSGNIRNVIKSKVLKVVGDAESLVNEKIKPLFETLENPSIAILASPVEVKIRVTARADSDKKADEMIAKVVEELYDLVGENVYGEDDELLEEKVAQLLFEKKFTVSTAESCTSGLVATRLTNIAGSSEYYIGGVNTYSDKLKLQLLDVNSEVIKQHGVVSDRCAKAMVLGCAEKFDTDCAIAITGIAGPGGGTEEKPVGLVYICILVKGQLRVFKYIFPGKRNVIRAKAAQMALFDLYSMLKML